MKTNKLDLIYKRRSTRKFTNENVPQKDILEILNAGHMAPSGSNQQPWKFIVIQDDEIKNAMHNVVVAKLDDLGKRIDSPKAEKLFLAYRQYLEFFKNAPVLIAVLCCPYDSIFTRILDKYKTQDEKTGGDVALQGTSACVQNMLLAAEALDYGSCWVSGPLIAKKELEKVLDIKDPYYLVCLVPIGKKAEVEDAEKFYRVDIKEKIIWK